MEIIQHVAFQIWLPHYQNSFKIHPYCSCCSTSLLTFGIIRLFVLVLFLHISHSNRWVMLPHSGYNLHFLSNKNVKTPFSFLFVISIFLIHVLLVIFKLILFNCYFNHSLYVLDISSL